MTLSEFCELIRNNIDSFEDDYIDKRKSHPNPDDAYPITLTPEMWFTQLDLWFRFLEITKNFKHSADIFENDEQNKTVEFKVDEVFEK